MAGKNFNLVEIIPEQNTFTDRDGRKYAVLNGLDFGPQDIATFYRLQGQMEQAQAEMKVAGADVDASERAMNGMIQTIDAMIHILIPSLPLDRIASQDDRAYIIAVSDHDIRVVPADKPRPAGYSEHAFPNGTEGTFSYQEALLQAGLVAEELGLPLRSYPRMSFNEKMRFVSWWNEVNPKPEGAVAIDPNGRGMARPVQGSMPVPSSRTWSPSIKSTRPRSRRFRSGS